MQRLADLLIDDMRAVIIAGVDVIDPARHGLAQHGERRATIFWRPERLRPGKLHRAIAHAVHGAVAQGENAGSGSVGHVRSPKNAHGAA